MTVVPLIVSGIAAKVWRSAWQREGSYLLFKTQRAPFPLFISCDGAMMGSVQDDLNYICTGRYIIMAISVPPFS